MPLVLHTSIKDRAGKSSVGQSYKRWNWLQSLWNSVSKGQQKASSPKSTMDASSFIPWSVLPRSDTKFVLSHTATASADFHVSLFASSLTKYMQIKLALTFSIAISRSPLSVEIIKEGY